MSNRLALVRAERGWTKARLIAGLRAAARRRGDELPKEESLSRRIAVWENQDGAVSDFYRDLICEVYGVPPAELGLVELAPDDGIAAEVEQRFTMSRLDAGLVDLLGTQTQNLRLLDRRIGALKLLQQTTAHVGQIEHLVRHALPNQHRASAANQLGQAASLAAWQALDMGRLDDAWRLYETATAAARESDDRAVLSYVRAEQAFVLLDADQPTDALTLVCDVQRGADRLPPVLRTWLLAAEGEIRAALGDRDGTLRVLGLAADALPDQAADPELPFVMLSASHLARWRGHCLARLGEPPAIDDLSDALGAMTDGQYGRAEASLRVDLAIAFAARGDNTEARTHAQRAADLAGRTGSARQRRRIDRLLSA